MEALAPWLGGLGLLGLITAVALGAVVLLILPLWAILHCLVSDRSGGTKAVVVLILILTWGPGALFYGLFVSGSTPFRLFSVAAVVLPLAILVPSVVGLGAGAALHGAAERERAQAEIARLIEEFRPAPLDGEGPDPFSAIDTLDLGAGTKAASLTRFTALGPDPATALAIDDRVRHVAHDVQRGRYFAVTDHAFGTVSPSTGRFTAIEVDRTVGDFAWPAGVAFDPSGDRVYVATSHVYTRFFVYDANSADWTSLPAELRGPPLVGLAHTPGENDLYALELDARDPALRRIHRFNHRGANVGVIELRPPIPLPDGTGDRLQLHHTSGLLAVVLPSGTPASPSGFPSGAFRVLYVDPRDGRVKAHPPA